MLTVGIGLDTVWLRIRHTALFRAVLTPDIADGHKLHIIAVLVDQNFYQTRRNPVIQVALGLKLIILELVLATVVRVTIVKTFYSKTSHNAGNQDWLPAF